MGLRQLALASVMLWAPQEADAQRPSPSEGSLLVLAAASLADVLPRIAREWEARSGVEVRFSFAATSRLAPQLTEGAPADVFVSADGAWMDWAEEQGGVVAGSRVSLATNDLVVVVPAAAPREATVSVIRSGDGRIALADANAPAGRYAKQALEREGAWAGLQGRIIRGGSVRGTLEWVARGEVEAGIVYRTDALAEPRVRIAREFEAGSHAPVVYPGAVATASTAPAAAAAFLEFAAGPVVREVWSAAGFGVREEGVVASIPTPATAPPNPWSAIRLSILVAFIATLAGLVPAIGLGWLLARREFLGKGLVATLVLVPLVLPPVVTGFILLSLLGSRSMIGQWLAALGLQVPFTLLGASLAALVVGLPLYVMAVRGAIEAVDARFEEVSWTLGVHRAATFRRVTLPLAIPGIAAGAVLAFARALGEFGATIVLAGNIEGSTQTIALAVYSLLESPSGHQATWILVGASVAISMAALLGYETLSRNQRKRLESHRG